MLSEYRIDSYSMAFGVFSTDETLPRDSVWPISPGEVKVAHDLVFNLNAIPQWVFQQGTERLHFRFSWIKSAYACSPLRYWVPTQRVERYTIHSAGSFGPEHPPGIDISDLFVEHSRNAPIASDISRFMADEITEEELPPLYQTLQLMFQPEEEDHTFTVIISLDDGSIYELVSDPISFQLED